VIRYSFDQLARQTVGLQILLRLLLQRMPECFQIEQLRQLAGFGERLNGRLQPAIRVCLTGQPDTRQSYRYDYDPGRLAPEIGEEKKCQQRQRNEREPNTRDSLSATLSAVLLFPLALLVIDRRKALLLLMTAVSGVPVLFVAGYLVYYPGFAAMWRYVKAALEISGGYSGAVGLPGGVSELATGLDILLCFTLLSIALLFTRHRQNQIGQRPVGEFDITPEVEAAVVGMMVEIVKADRPRRIQSCRGRVIAHGIRDQRNIQEQHDPGRQRQECLGCVALACLPAIGPLIWRVRGSRLFRVANSQNSEAACTRRTLWIARVLTLVRPQVIQDAPSLRRQFQNARPFRYVVIDDFLDPGYCSRLVAEFPSFDIASARNELGQVGGKSVHPDLARIGPAYEHFDRMLQSADFLALMSEITSIPKLLYDPEYVGGGTHENRNGQDLDPHIDFNYHPGTRRHRRLNLIVFLNPEWDPSWGGSLDLSRDPSLPSADDEIATVVPLLNRCVIFETTEHSWHGFKRIALPPGKEHLSRKSIAVYFYTKERPRPETAASHGTIYVQRPLPDHIRAGYTLRDEDMHELNVLLARRDTHIQYLYERELEFTRIAQSPSFRLARMLTWPMRVLRKRRAI
jgi:2OG-Fe(II) oxygenase superfamily